MVRCSTTAATIRPPSFRSNDHSLQPRAGLRPRFFLLPVIVTLPVTDAAPKHHENNLHRGVPGTVLCRYNLSATKRAPHNADAGQPSRRDDLGRFSTPGGGRRRAIGVVAVLQSSLSRPRRWCDAGSPKADQKAGASGRHDHDAFSSRRRSERSTHHQETLPTSLDKLVGTARLARRHSLAPNDNPPCHSERA